MSISIFGLIFFLLGAFAQLKKPTFIISVLIISTVLGAASAVDLAGKPVLPAIFMLGFLCVYLLKVKDIDKLVVQAFRQNPSVGYLFAFVVFSCLASYFLPRFFSGEVWVYNLQDNKYVEQLLRFSGSHVAQIFYVLAGFLFFLTAIVLVRQRTYMLAFADALLILGVINVVLGLSDLVFYNLGLPDYLTYLKNANYAIVDQSMGGLRRIAGSFSETSSFSRFTAGLLAFSYFTYRGGYRKRLSGFVAIFSLLLVLLSTSSSGYVALMMFAAVLIYAERAYLFSGYLTKGLFFTLIVLGFTACTIILLFPDQVLSIVDSAIVNKLDSDSGVERSEWNAAAWSNFLQTYGFGVGLGGNKASSFVLVLLSNVGWIGLLLYALFFTSVLAGRSAHPDFDYNTISGAAKAAVLVMLAPALFTATSAFIGSLFYLLLPLAACSKGFSGVSKSFNHA